MSFKLIEKVFDEANTPERICATTQTCTSVKFQIQRANSNKVEISPETFATGKGFELVKPTADEKLDTLEFTSPGREGINLNEWYAMGAQGEGINIIIEEF